MLLAPSTTGAAQADLRPSDLLLRLQRLGAPHARVATILLLISYVMNSRHLLSRGRLRKIGPADGASGRLRVYVRDLAE